MREGSLENPVRHPLDWQDPDFVNKEAVDAELRRVFDVCHGCRRCFNLCDSFPRLFDLIDAAPTGELDSVKSQDFTPVVDACTLCDLCYILITMNQLLTNFKRCVNSCLRIMWHSQVIKVRERRGSLYLGL